MNALEKLKELHEKSTKGIWDVHKQPGDGLAPGFGPKNNPVGECWHIKDAVAIVFAHNALPALIELVEAQEQMLLGMFGEWGGGTPDDVAQKVMDAQYAWHIARARLEEAMR